MRKPSFPYRRSFGNIIRRSKKKRHNNKGGVTPALIFWGSEVVRSNEELIKRFRVKALELRELADDMTAAQRKTGAYNETYGAVLKITDALKALGAE